jgi:uncharacterized protein involved in exopolysaccharide biosynthesis
MPPVVFHHFALQSQGCCLKVQHLSRVLTPEILEHKVEEEISLRDIYLILKKHVRWIIIPAIVFTVLAAIYAFFLVAPEFTSEATLTVQSTQIQAKSSDQLQTQSVQGFSNSQITTIATSRPVLEQVLKTARVNQDVPSEWMKENFDAEQLGKKLKVSFAAATPGTPDQVSVPIFTLTANAPNAAISAVVANTWANQTVARLNQLPKDRLESTITTIQGQLDRAEKNLATTEQAFQAFSTSSTLTQDQAELAASTDERTKLTDELAQATQALDEIKAQLKTQNENLLNAEAVIPQNNNPNNPNTNSNTNAITSMSGDLETVRTNLSAQTQTARQRYLETSNAVQAFEANNTIPVLQGRVDSIVARLNVISTRLQSIQTELNVAQSRLTDTKAQLAKQPQLLNLNREITSDPAIMATITANQSGLKSLIGLKLQNQEINPAFQDLLQASIELQLTFNNINNENTAFVKEKTSLEKLLPTLQTHLAALNQKRSRVMLEADIAQTVYTGLQNRLAQLAGIRNTGTKPLRLDNPNIEYQRLRSSVSDLSVLEARQNATFTALNARATQLDNRIVLLRGRVAKASVENTRLSDRLSLAQQEFKALTQKLADLKIEQASSGNLAQVLVPAFAPTRKSNSALFIVAIMGVVGLLIGLMIPFLIEGVREPTPIELMTPEMTKT